MIFSFLVFTLKIEYENILLLTTKMYLRFLIAVISAVSLLLSAALILAPLSVSSLKIISCPVFH